MSENRDKSREPDCALKHIKSGAFGFGGFQGQHLLFIPMRIYEKLGEEKINEIAIQIYSTTNFEEFVASRAMYQHSFMLELPPEIDRLRKFVAALRNAARDALKQASLNRP
ncbi:MAG: hypothetical protein ACOYUZ_04875 [Patescibacteria group bacterium]